MVWEPAAHQVHSSSSGCKLFSASLFSAWMHPSIQFYVLLSQSTQPCPIPKVTIFKANYIQFLTWVRRRILQKAVFPDLWLSLLFCFFTVSQWKCKSQRSFLLRLYAGSSAVTGTIFAYCQKVRISLPVWPRKRLSYFPNWILFSKSHILFAWGHCCHTHKFMSICT